MTLNDVLFDYCELHDSDFTETSFKGIDLSTCEFDTIQIDANALKGLTIRFDQAASLLPPLGVTIKY